MTFKCTNINLEPKWPYMTHILEELTLKMEGQPLQKRCQLGSTNIYICVCNQ